MKNYPFLAFLLWLSLTFCQRTLAQSAAPIVPDGKTQTTVTVNGNVTGITTNTIRGANGFNSFTTFNVAQGTTTNLFLPSPTENLFNIVNGSLSTIDGVLNSIKNGQIGGRVFFINPYGLVVGSTGIVNAVALTVVTPTKGFLSSFFDATGNVSDAAATAVLTGNVPLTGDGLISVRGRINALTDIRLAGGQVTNSGMIGTGAVFVARSPNFSDVVNIKGLQAGSQIATTNGNIEIVAANDFENSGTISTDGVDGVNGGNISVEAGNDARLIGNSVISSSGSGSNSNAGNISILANGNGYLTDHALVKANGGNISGDGGSIEVSAKGTLNLDGGLLKAGAVNGTAGTATLDPTDLIISANDEPNDGTNLDFPADNSITVNPGVIISSRQIGSGTDALKSPSTGNSGNISFEAPQITVSDGASILAHATGGFTPGDITMTATQSASDPVVLPSISANAQISIGNATISGGNISITADAEADANKTPSSAANSVLNDTSLGTLVGSYGIVSYKAASATSAITIGDSTSAGTASINGTGNVTIKSTAGSTSVSDLVGTSGFAYGHSDSSATATVAKNATVSASGSLAINSESNDTLSVKESTTANSPGVIAVAYGNASSSSTTQIDGSASGSTVQIGATNTNNFDTQASAKPFSTSSGSAPANGGGAGIALGFYKSSATANVTGSVTSNSGDATISSNSNNEQDTVFSSSAVPTDGGFGSKIANFQNIVQNFGGYLSQSTLLPNSVQGTGQVSQLGIAASVSYLKGSNAATTTVTGKVSSENNVNISSTATDAPQIGAAGSVSGTNTGLGGAVAIGNFSNTADTSVNGGAQVNSLSGSTSITADATMENPAVNRADLIADDQKFSGALSDIESVLKDIGTALGILGNPGEFTTSFVNAGLTTQAGDLGLQGDNIGLAGSVSVLDLTNQATASVTGTGTSVKAGYNLDGSVGASANGNVNISADSNLTSLNVAGMGFSVGQVATLNPGVNSGTSLGGSADIVKITNNSVAYVDDGTTVKAASTGSSNGQVNVSSDSETFQVAVAQAGDKAEQFGVSGTVNYLDLNGSSSAYIQSDATVAATNDVEVNAANNLFDIAVGGALGWGGKGQLDVGVNWNEINQTTLAYIGDPSNSRISICTDCGVTAGGDVNVDANSSEHLYAVTLAAASSGNAPRKFAGPLTAKQAANGAGGGYYSFGASGVIAINDAGSADSPGIDTQAFINDGANVSANGKVNADSGDSSLIVSAALAGTLSTGAGVDKGSALAGAYNQNSVSKDVEAFTANSKISGSGLSVDATGANNLYAVTAGGAVDTNTGLSLAGAVNNNSLTNTIKAYVGDQTSAPSLGSDGVIINADENDNVVSVAGVITLANKGAGVGAGIDIGDYTDNVDSYVGDANVGAAGNIQITASTSENLLPIGASLAAGLKGLMASGSLAYETLNNDTEAYIGDNAKVSTPDNILLGSSDNLTLFEIAGDISGSGNAAFGASADVNDFTRKSIAYIGKNATVTASGNGTAPSFNSQSNNGLGLFALSNSSLETFAAGGAGAGDFGIAGSAVVNLLKDTTYAYIDQSARVNPDNSEAASGQDVNLLASDTTNITSLAGGIGIGGDAGIGAGADVAIVHKDTEAWIGKSAQVNAADNVEVQAVSNEDFGSIAGAAAIGGSAGIAGAASVYIINDKTLANVDSLANVFSDGNVLVSAQDLTDLDQIAGNLSISGSAGVGASATVDDIKKDTEAHIQMGASVTGLGLAPAIQADTGQFTYSYVPNHGFGEVPSLGITVSEDPDPALAGQQVATPAAESFTGVAVTAVSTTATQRLTVAGSAAGALAASLSGSVDLENLTTTASIDSGANVNTASDSGAGADQSVLVAAGSNVFHMGLLGGLAISGSVGVGPSADISLISNNTTATIDDSADVQAQSDIGVNANGAEDFLSAAVGAAGSLDVSVAGGVSVVSVNDTTKATIGNGATADAGGNVLVSANDATSTDLLDGALAIGLTVGGVSGSVGVTLIDEDTEASVGSDAQVNAKGNSSDLLSLFNDDAVHGLAVQANSTENLFNATAGGAGGFIGGIAGDVTVENVQATTKASVDSGAQINQSNSGAASAQAVEVLAQDGTTITAYNGALGGGLIGGGAGAVNVSTVDNATSASIGDKAAVNSQGNISVLGNSSVNGTDGEVSAAAGAIGIAGAVSVWNINSGIGSEGQNNTSGVSSYTSGAGSTSLVTGTLSPGDSNQQQAVGDVNNTSLSTSTSSAFDTTPAVPPGTSAFIGNKANVSAGGNLSLQANNNLNLNVTDGSGALGLVSVGGAVGIANIGSETQAYADSGSTLNAGGNLSISADLNEPTVSITTYDGVVNLGGAGVSYIKLSDTGTTDAYVGSGAQATSKDDLIVEATANRTDSGTTSAYSGGGIAVGASLSTVTLGGTTEAHVDDASATSTEGGVNVEASLTDNAAASSDGIGGALATGVGTNPIATDNTNTYAYATGDAALSSSGTSTIEAQANRTATSSSGAQSYGAIAVGASLSTVTLGGTTEAYLDNASATSTKGGINVEASLTDNATASSNGVGGALASGVGAYPIATDTTNTYAYATGGAVLSSSGTMTVEAKATRNATANSGSKSYGAVSVGESLASVDIGGETKAYLDSGAQVGSIATPLGGLNVEASDTDTGTATATPLAGGFGAGVGGKTTDDIHPTVSAYDNGASVDVRGAMSVNASDSSTVASTVVGTQLGAITGGSVDAEGSASPTISAYVNGGTASAGSIAIDASGDQSMAVSGASSASSSFVSGMSISATATLNPTISATVDGDANLTASHDISVSSDSTNSIYRLVADGTGGAFSVGSGGSTNATATIINDNSVTIGSATLTSTNGNLTVQASSDNSLGNVSSYTYAGSGLVNVGGATTKANIADLVSTTLETGSDLEAPTGNLAVASSGSENVGVSAANPNGLSAVAQSNAEADVGLAASIATDVKDGAQANAHDTNIAAEITRLAAGPIANATSDATASARGVLGVGAYATSYMDTAAASTVEISNGATVTGSNSLTLDAGIDGTTLANSASTVAKAGIVPIAEATAINNANLAASVQVDPGSTLNSNSLTVNALKPSAGAYSNSAYAHYTFYAIFGIPISGTGTENTGGGWINNNLINMNGTLQQSAAFPALLVNADGSYSGPLKVLGEDGTDIVLKGISPSDAVQNVVLNAPGGTVEGSMGIDPSLLVVNNSNLSLIIQDVSAQGGGSGNITVNSAVNSLKTVVGPMPITIENNSGSNVVFAGNVADPGGSLNVTDQGGSVFSTQNNKIQVTSATLNAPNGAIGSTGGEIPCAVAGCPASELQLSPMNLFLTPTLQTLTETLSPGQLSAVARNDVNLNLTPDATPLTGAPVVSSVPLQLSKIVAGGDINVGLNPGVISANGGQKQVNGDYQIPSGDWVGAGGEFAAVLNGTNGATPTLTVDGTLTSGFESLSVTANADGTFASILSAAGAGSADLNYVQSTGSLVQVGNIDASRSGISITGTGDLAGSGTLALLNGASDITITNHSNLPLATNAVINTGAAGMTDIALNGTVSITPGSYGSPSGQINVSSDSTSINLQNLLSNPTGSISVNSGTDIAGPTGVTHIRSKNIQLTAGGSIGPDLGIEMTQPLGVLDAKADGSIALTANGDISIGNVTSQTGDVSLTASGSIVSASSVYQPNIFGRNLTLTANNGSIGSSDGWLSTQATGVLNAFAGSDVFLRQISGDLNSQNMISRSGSINLIVDKGNGYLQNIQAPQHALLTVNGNLLNIGVIDSNNIKAILAGRGGVATVNSMFVGAKVDFTADILHILRLVHTSASNPLIFDITTTQGGFNKRPVDPGIVLANIFANREHRDRERRFGLKKQAEPAADTVIDMTNKPPKSGGAQ